MAFRIKRIESRKSELLTEEKYEDAIHVALGLIREGSSKARITVTNLKTGEILGQDEIEEAAISVGARKRRSFG